MLTAYTIDSGRLRKVLDPPHLVSLGQAVWIDLVTPTPEESTLVQDVTGLQVASRAELEEIESSSRLAFEDQALYLSAPIVTRADRYDATTSPLGLAINARHLITVRFAESRVVEGLADKTHTEAITLGSPQVFVILLEALVDRLADVLERINTDLDTISGRIFQDRLGSGEHPKREDQALRDVLRAVGLAGDLLSRIRETLLGIGRMIPYTEQMGHAWMPAELSPRFTTLRQDIASLSDHDGHLSSKVQFLLDATLGFIGIAQSNIIKLLTVVSVVGIPPTLVASIYGMNFKNMPELNWAWGYPYGLVVIVLSAVIPLVVFRLRGWL